MFATQSPLKVQTAGHRQRRAVLVRCASAGSGSFGGLPQPAPSKRPNPCGVFQLSDHGPVIDLADVRDACEACSTARTPQERRQCFEVYGLDVDKVDRYYERVEQMERLIDQGDSVGQGLVTSGGAMMLYMMAYLILRV